MAFTIKNVRNAGSNLISLEVEFSNGERGEYQYEKDKSTRNTILADLGAIELRVASVNDVATDIRSLKGASYEPVAR